MTDAWPLLTYAGLGAFHALNPEMGWLFAVALGLQRQSRAIVMASLVPIAIGHAITVVAGLLVIAGILIPHYLARIGSSLLLLGWAAYQWRFAHRHRVRFGFERGGLRRPIPDSPCRRWAPYLGDAHHYSLRCRAYL